MIGERKIPNEFIKLSRDVAELYIFHGTKAQPPRTVRMIAPRLMLMYLGHRLVMSFAPLMTVAEMLTQICARAQLKPAKKAAALPAGPSQVSTMEMGSHRVSP